MKNASSWLFVSLLAASSVASQVQWTQVTTSPMPRARYGHAMCYDSGRQRVVLFGGYDPFVAYFSDTWEWDGVAWLLKNPPSRPSARYGCLLAYDAARAKCVLHGGGDFANTYLTDTWEWDGTDWTKIAAALPPPPRIGQAICYDEGRHRVVMFGGSGPVGPWDDTWEYDGVTWRQILTPTRPYIRINGALQYVSSSSRVYLFGGHSGVQIADLWEYDGLDWRLITPSGPPGRSLAGLVHDAARERLVVFGGSGASGVRNDTWEWTGQSWLLRAPLSVPTPRDSFGLVYDVARERTVLFGGTGAAVFGDHWEYATRQPARFVAFGAACIGSTGFPALASVNGTRPWAGEAFSILATHLPPQQPAVLEIGLSKTTYLGLVLPHDLGTIGMTGCWLHVSAESALGGSSGSGTALFTIPVPSAPSAIGSLFYDQAFVLDPAANALGIVSSNAAERRIGSK